MLNFWDTILSYFQFLLLYPDTLFQDSGSSAEGRSARQAETGAWPGVQTLHPAWGA